MILRKTTTDQLVYRDKTGSSISVMSCHKQKLVNEYSQSQVLRMRQGKEAERMKEGDETKLKHSANQQKESMKMEIKDVVCRPEESQKDAVGCLSAGYQGE